MTQVTLAADHSLSVVLRPEPFYLLEAKVTLLVLDFAYLLLHGCRGIPVSTARKETAVLRTPTTQPETVSRYFVKDANRGTGAARW